MQSPKRRRSTKTTKKRQTSKEDAFRLKAEPLLEALDSAIFQISGTYWSGQKNIRESWRLSDGNLVGAQGFEPGTYGLRVRCSTN